MNRDEHFLRYWGVARLNGKGVYAFKGALIFTVLFAVFKELVYWGVFEQETYSFNLGRAVIGFAIMLVIMYFYKRWEWKKNEARFNSLMDSNRKK
jgi:inner membrane protein involved in colicin E2 resistance